MRVLILSTFTIVLSVSVIAQSRIVAEDILHPSKIGSSEIHGYIGERLDACIQNGVMSKDYQLYINAFKDRTDDPSRWAGEFWGKWFTSAALAYRYKPYKEYREILDDAVEGLLKTQDQDGRLSSYKNDFGDWDIWGRKYSLLGLVAYYDQTGDKNALESASKSLDEIINVSGPGKRKLTETGLSLLEALSSSSILEPIVLIYERTGNKRYLDFAEYIVSLWSEPNEYTEDGMRLVEDAIAGVDPINISAPKGYEQMSCYEGLAELYRVTGKKKYLDAVVTFGHKVLEKEIMIVGSGSSGELWIDGAIRQTEMLEQPMETCVTVTWIKFCNQLLRLTGDPIWADAMEVTLYNSLLSAMADNGSWWAYFSPLTGERMPSPMQVPSCNSSCCVANGPRGLLTIPEWAIMQGEAGPVINLYAPGKWKYELANKSEITLEQKTSYPENDNIEIKVNQKKSERYTVKLRIPEWSKDTKIKINGEIIKYEGSGYVAINRVWKNGDIINLNLDLRGRVITSPASVNNLAIMRGPIVLALDNRLVKEEDINLWLLSEEVEWKYNKDWKLNYVLFDSTTKKNGPKKEVFIDLKPVDTKPEGVWMAFETPFLYRPTHFVKHKKKTLVLCDYASAGNEYSNENMFRVWMPQPMYMSNIFPKNTWKLLYYKSSSERPKFPAIEQSNHSKD